MVVNSKAASYTIGTWSAGELVCPCEKNIFGALLGNQKHEFKKDVI